MSSWSLALRAMVLAGLLAANAGVAPVQGAGHERKIDPFLRLQIDPDRTPLFLQGLGSGTGVEVIIRATVDPTRLLERHGAEVRTVLGGGALTTAVVPRSAVATLAADPRITFIEASKPLVNFAERERRGPLERGGHPRDPLEVSVAEIRVPQVWAQTDRAGNPMRGKGVILGVVDSGIDTKHGDFKDAAGRSRILSVWDQTATGSGTADGAYKYGIECTKTQLDGGTCAEKDPSGHGTHVASIAAGSGLAAGNPAKFLGVAPDAEIVFVKLGAGALTAGRAVDAWKYVIDRAAALKRPVVINNSWGHSLGAKDGSDALELAIDLLAGPGRIFVNAAGNGGRGKVHAGGSVLQSQSATVTVGFPTPSESSELLATFWYKGADSMSLTLETSGGQKFGPVQKGGSAKFTAGDGTRIVIDATLAPYPANNDNLVVVALERPEPSTMSGNWSFTLRGESIKVGGRFDAWLPLASGLTGYGSEEFTSSHGTLDMQLGEPATARRTLAVANYVTKTCIQSVSRGRLCSSEVTQAGGVAPSSSRGPTRDQRQKPDIAAPGSFITAALSADSPVNDPKDGDYFLIDPSKKHIVEQGTSMAAPHVAGVVALMLQKRPVLTPEEAMTALSDGARRDARTGPGWSAAWGRGKLDALGAVEKTAVVPMLTAPVPAAGSATNLVTLGTTLNWTNPTGATQIQVQVTPANNDGPGINVIREAATAFTIPEPVFGAGPYLMLPNMTYSWRVRASAAPAAIDEGSPWWGPWSPSSSFRTRAVSGNTIRAVAPAVGSTAAPRVPAITWTNSDTGVFYYELELSKDPAFGAQGPVAMIYSALLHGGATTPPNTYVVPSSAPLEPSTTYHWRVRPRVQGDGIPVAWPPAFSFTTVP